MHLTWDVSIGQLVLTAPTLALVGYMIRIYNMLIVFRMEHEMLMEHWAKSQKPPVDLNNLPWRRRKRHHK